MKIVKASIANPNGKSTPGDKILGLDPDIQFYEIEDDGKNQEGEYSDILVIHHSSLAQYKQNLIKRKFPYIDKFDHEVLAVIHAMHNITVRVSEHL